MAKIKDLYYEIGYKVNDEGIKKADKNVDGLTSNITDLVGKAAGVMAIGLAFSKVKDYIGSSITEVAEFDRALRTAGSKMGVDEDGLGVLGENARQVGLEFNTMAKDVAVAQNYLALAGFDLEKTTKATDDLVAVQKASGESMATVADIITDVSTAYRYSADELGIVGDMAVYTSSKFNTGVAELGEAYKYVVPVAREAGLELSDLNGYLGVLANNMIKGSQAGTIMRASITRLQAPTKEAAAQLRRYGIETFNRTTGEWMGYNEVLKQIGNELPKMTDKQRALFMQTVFGQEAISGMNILFGEGIGKIEGYGNAIAKSEGQAKEMAKFMDAGLDGSIKSLNVNLNETKLLVGTMFEGISVKALEDATGIIKNLNEQISKDQQETADFLTGFYEIMSTGSGAIGGFVGDFISNTADIINTAGTGGGARNLLQDFGSNVSFLGFQDRASRQFLDDASKGKAPTNIGGFSPTLNLTIQTNGGPLTRDQTNPAIQALESTLDNWYDNKMKKEINRLR